MAEKAPIEKLAVNMKEAGVMLGGVHGDTVRKLLDEKQLPFFYVAARIMIPIDAIEQFIAKGCEVQKCGARTGLSSTKEQHETEEKHG